MSKRVKKGGSGGSSKGKKGGGGNNKNANSNNDNSDNNSNNKKWLDSIFSVVPIDDDGSETETLTPLKVRVKITASPKKEKAGAGKEDAKRGKAGGKIKTKEKSKGRGTKKAKGKGSKDKTAADEEDDLNDVTDSLGQPPPPTSAATSNLLTTPPTSPTKRSMGGPGAKRTKPPGETQDDARIRCENTKKRALALLQPLHLDAKEATYKAQDRKTLRDPEDELYISPLNCLVRSQIELFVSSATHPKATFVGQLGLRCVHCADCGETTVRGQEKFTTSMAHIEAAVRNWHRCHTVYCPHMPPDIKAAYDELRAMGIRAGNRKIKYYPIANARLGLEDVYEKGSGGSEDTNDAGNGGKDGKDKKKGGGKTVGVRLSEYSTITVATSDGVAGPKSKKRKRKEAADKSEGGGADGGAESDDADGSDAESDDDAFDIGSLPPPTPQKIIGKSPRPSLPAMLVKVAADDAMGIVDHSIPECPSSVTAEERKKAAAAAASARVRRKGDEPLTTNVPREVVVLDAESKEVIKTFASTSEAARGLDINRSRLSRTCRAGGGVIGKYYIRFADLGLVEPDQVMKAMKKSRSMKKSRMQLESLFYEEGEPTETDMIKYISKTRKENKQQGEKGSSATSKADEKRVDSENGSVKGKDECKKEKKVEKDEEDSKPAAAKDIPSQEVLDSAVDKLMQIVSEAKPVKEEVDSSAEEKKEIETEKGANDGEDGAFDAEGTGESARQKLIRHQLMQRIKMASRAGITPEEFSKRFMEQIRINKEREEEAQKQRERSDTSTEDDDNLDETEGEEHTEEGNDVVEAVEVDDEADAMEEGSYAEVVECEVVEDEEEEEEEDGAEEDPKKKASKSKSKKTATKKKAKAKSKTAKHKLSRKDLYPSNATERAQGPWTEEETQRLIEGMELYQNIWVKVAEHVGTRKPTQCKSKAQKLQKKLEQDRAEAEAAA